MSNKCLLVGINKYPGSPLRGCVNDIKNMSELLVAKKYFQVEDIRILVDERATTQAILDRLNWLTTDITAGDRVYFGYSGHGAQVPTRDKTGEVDGLNECICPVNFDWTPEHMIIDKQFVSIFSKIPAGVLFNWTSDSCHSGDLDRNIDRVPRSYPVPFDIEWRGKVAKKKNITCERSLTNGILDVGFISGCEDHQTSADAFIGEKPCGAFTYFLIQNILTCADKPLNKLVGMIQRSLRKNGYDQIPQAEGTRKTKPFLK